MEQPKVRFTKSCQTWNQNQEADKSKNDAKKKVKIKSIEPANFSLKVSKNGKHIIIRDQKNGNAKESPIEIDLCKESEWHAPNIISADQCHNTRSDLSESYDVTHFTNKLKTLTIEDSKDQPLYVANQNDNNNHCNLDFKRSDVENNEENAQSTISDHNDDYDIEIIKEIQVNKKYKNFNGNTMKQILDHKNKASQLKNKENFSKSYSSIKVHNKSSSMPNILKDTTNPKLNYTSKNNAVKKPVTINNRRLTVMPCVRSKITSTTANKSTKTILQAQRQKQSLFNITGNNTKISVKAAPLLKQSVADDDEINFNRNNIISSDLLAHPEYNSTICVVKKLKDLRKEKLITNCENLPSAYKNLINGKVSAALDFPPCESVFKNLINISVEDNNLPVRLMRSKDPQPRDKDIVPKLSDFYNPKFTEQFLIIATPVVKEPINVNTLNSFKISKKICTWKKYRDSNI